MNLTVSDLRESFPRHLRVAATQELVDKLNTLTTDPEEAKLFRDGLVSYANVLEEGRFKTEDYVNAVVYVSHKMLGCSNQKAWKKTFPGRHQNLVAGGADEQKISAYVSAYNSNKLVNLVLAQTLVPTWVLNADIYQKAINTQFELMTDPDVSAKVRTEAANSILTHLKQPEVKKIQLDLGVRENAGMTELKDMMRQLAEQQREMISGGVATEVIAHQTLRVIDLGDIEDGVEVGAPSAP